MKSTDEAHGALQSTEPERFDPSLLLLPTGARQEYFEHHCLVEHPRLLEALETTVRTICSPGEGAQLRRPGTMVLVIGPSRVGKTTLIRLLEERLLAYAKAQMLAACRREHSSSPPSRSPRERVLYGTGRATFFCSIADRRGTTMVGA